MSTIVYKAIQKSNAQVREETRKQNTLDLAAKALAANFDPAGVQTVFGLSDVELQDLLAQVTK